MPTQRLRIPGLRHQDEAELSRRLRAIPGVYYAVLNHLDECAEIDFEDDAVSLAEICRAVRDFGYDADIAG
jgi:hypothetical protein